MASAVAASGETETFAFQVRQSHLEASCALMALPQALE